MPERKHGKFIDSYTIESEANKTTLDVGKFLDDLSVQSNDDMTDRWQSQITSYSPERKAEMIWSIFRELQRAIWHSSKTEKTIKKNFGTEEVVPGRADQVVADQSLYERAVVLRLLWNDDDARDLFQTEYARHLQEEKSVNGEYEKYQELLCEIRALEQEHDRLMTRMFAARGRDVEELLVMRLETVKTGLTTNRDRLERLTKTNPELSARMDYEKIVAYKKELDTEGFAWLPSRRQFLERLEQAMLSSRPIMVMSESGAGKTSIISAAARRLTGEDMARSPGGKHSRPEKLFFTRDLSGDRSYLRYGPLTEAISGKNNDLPGEKSGHHGRVFLDDEFNNRDSDDQLEIVKALSSGLTPGREFQLPNTTRREKIQPNAVYIAAGNPVSDRYDREDTDPAVIREFGDNILPLDYPEQSMENPELYDYLRACLMRGNRLPPLSLEHELSPTWIVDATTGRKSLDTSPKAGGFLWRFANTWRGMFDAYGHKQNQAHLNNPSDPKETYYLDTLLLDLGVVRGWLEEWQKTRRQEAIEDFFKEKLNAWRNAPTVSEHDYSAVTEIMFAHDIFVGDRLIHDPRQLAEVSRARRNLTPEDIGFSSPTTPQRRESIKVLPPETKKIPDEDGNDIEYFDNDTLVGFKIGAVFVRKGKKPTKANEVKIIGRTDDERLVVRNQHGVGLVFTTQEFNKFYEIKQVEAGQPFAYDRAKAREYGLVEENIPAHPKAQILIDKLMTKDSAYVTEHKAGQPDPADPNKTLAEDKTILNNPAIEKYWQDNCPDLPNIPEKSMWYLKQLVTGKITNTINNDDKNTPGDPHQPDFAHPEFLLAMDWAEFNWSDATDKETAKNKSQAIITKLFPGKQGVTAINRNEINEALWADHDQKIQSDTAKALISELTQQGEPSDFELRLIRQDEYVRLAQAKNWGQKDLWTHFDGYNFHGDGARDGLLGGHRAGGGAARVDDGWRDDRHGSCALRLVLARKS
jgi:hypothetical protein